MSTPSQHWEPQVPQPDRRTGDPVPPLARTPLADPHPPVSPPTRPPAVAPPASPPAVSPTASLPPYTAAPPPPYTAAPPAGPGAAAPPAWRPPSAPSPTWPYTAPTAGADLPAPRRPEPYPRYPGGGPPSAAVQRPELADWVRRVAAFAIDILLIYTPPVLAYAVYLGTADVGPGWCFCDSPAPTPAGAVALLLGWSTWIGVWVWTRIVQQGRRGQSLGKRLLGIRLVRLDTGLPVGAGTALGRELSHGLIDNMAWIGYLWPLWDQRRQTFADMLCGTVVVRVGQPHLVSTTTDSVPLHA